MLFLSKKRIKVSKTKLSSAPPILKHGVYLRWPNRTFFCDTPRRIPAQGNWSLWPISACFCVLGNFTGQNRLFVVHSGTADAISVQKNGEKCQKRNCPPPPPILKHGAPPSLSGYADIDRSTTWWKWRPSTNCLDMSVSLVAHLRAILSTSNTTIFARCAPCWRADGGGVRVVLLQHCLQLRLLDLVVATFQ